MNKPFQIAIIGAGFVGLKCYEKLKTRFDCLCTVKTQQSLNALKEKNIPVILLDSSNADSLNPLFEHAEILIIAVAPKDRSSYKDTYLKLASNIKKNFAKFKRLKQIFVLSSTSVYAEEQGSVVEENSPLNSHDENSKILVETEKTYLSLTNFTKTCIIRLGEIYGQERSLFLKLKKLDGREIPSDGMNPSNLSHVDDIACFIEFAINHELSGIYNLVASEHPYRKKLYEKVAKQHNLPMPIFNSTLPQKHGKSKIVLSNKIKSTGWLPKFDLIEY